MYQRGFNMIELLVGVAVAGILFAVAAPSMRTMIENTKVKSAAESALSGLRLARSEAIKRNAPMRFQMVSTLTAACAYSTASALWVVSQTDQTNYGEVAGGCNQAPAIPPDPCGSPCTASPYIAYKSATTSGGSNVVVAADAAVVTFGPLGQVLANKEGTASLTQVNISSTDAGAKARRVRVAVPGGTVKLCDPAVAAGQPQACS